MLDLEPDPNRGSNTLSSYIDTILFHIDTYMADLLFFMILVIVTLNRPRTNIAESFISNDKQNETAY
jgi:hypothetical protein